MSLQSGRKVQRSSASKRPSLTDSICVKIRDRIVFSEILPNQLLVESRLAEEYGVSKTPVREALGLLSQEGLVEVIPRVGYRVTPIGIHDVHEVFHLRFLLEPEAGALAARRGTRDEVVALQKADREELEHLAAQERFSMKSYVCYHDAFHLGIATLSGSKRLTRIIRSLLRDSTRVRIHDPLMGAEGLDEDREFTEQLTGALLEKDETEARRLMSEHLKSSKARILEELSDPELQATLSLN